jgi:murein DD-endopeptidase MepM/ murein hydrolase activator NlpD
MKKYFFISIILFGNYFAYSQQEKNVLDFVIQCYEDYYKLNKEVVSKPETPKQETPKQEESKPEVATQTKPKQAPIYNNKANCPPEPADFYNFFKTTFIDFRSLREEEKVNSFSFSDSLCAPLHRKLELTSKYGMRNGSKHFGVDFALNVGDPVCSIFCGKVRVAKWDKTYGYVLVVRHYNMSEAVYAHLDKILVSVNQEIRAGQIIGLGGNTGHSSGPHLHFELRYKGFPMNPIINGKFLTLLPVWYP